LPFAFCLSSPIRDDAHDVGFGGELAFDVRFAVHLLHATADAQGGDRKRERVAGDYGASEARVVYAAEEDELALVILDLLERVDRADLRHRLDDEDAGHDGRAGEVPLKEMLAYRHLLDADDAFARDKLDDAINEQEGISVRQNPLDGDYVERHFHKKIRKS
jgi:hypothetical protein